MLTPQQNLVAGHLIRERMAKGTTFRFRVISNSMAPMIRAGDRVTVSRVGVEDLRRGDIVLYVVGETFHTHRLLSVRREDGAMFLVTKGDNALSPDQPWREEQLLGKVVAIGRGERWVDLESRPWRAANRLLGALAQWEVALLRAGRALKRALLGERRSPLTSLGVRLIAAPFRLCGRLLVLFIE
ncbi:MAG TPA: signal peptidase I [Anaerolineae bacterium]|nr:signal peptidase I [Anaerolineae bacterium]